MPDGRHECPICGRAIARTHFKRHVNAHERRGVPVRTVNAAWVAFVDRYYGNGRDFASALRHESDEAHERLAAVRHRGAAE